MPSTAAPTPPNIVLVVLDTVRRDATGLSGARLPCGDSPTPRLDHLAANGTVFDNAWAVAPWTVPSHAAMFSGQLPHPSDPRRRQPAGNPGVAAMAGTLRGRGYSTAAFYSNPWLSSRASGLLRGFEQQIEARIGGLDELENAAGDQGGSETVENIRTWLAESPPQRPFFLFVNLLEAHLPYDPPTEVRHDCLGTAGDHPRVPITWGHAVNAAATVPSEDDWSLVRTLYLGDVWHADRLLGELLGVLDAAHALDHSVVIVTSDHGEHLGEHGRAEHQFSLHEALLAVPLVIRATEQGLAPGPRHEPVTHLDLLPTVLTLAGAPMPPDARAGRSLLSPPQELAEDWPLAAVYPPPPKGLLATLVRANPAVDLAPLRRGYRTVRIRDLRLTAASDGAMSLHRPSVDPLQEHDLWPGTAEEVEPLLAALPARVPASSSGEIEPGGELDDATRGRLEALGYLDRERSTDPPVRRDQH